MNVNYKHKRILLNKNPTGEIEYCEACDLVELALGPVSIRLHAKDLVLFSQLVSEAETRLSYYEAEKKRNHLSIENIDNFH